MKPRIKQSAYKSKWEAAYAQQLELLKRAGEIIDYRYEAQKLILAHGPPMVTYTPDFLVVYPDRLEFHEVKGHYKDHHKTKTRIAQELHPWYVFKLIRYKNGHSMEEEV
jgi:hypothetical protein